MAEHDSGAGKPTPALTGFTRRAFVGAGVLGGASLLTGGFDALLHASAAAADIPNGELLGLSIAQLQLLMVRGEVSSVELTRAYLERIRQLNPLLGAVIETNRNAVATAALLDTQRRNGQLRGPLHGIPILLKDNIATSDEMHTTAGSLALLGNRVPRDANVAAKLRQGGAVFLGKANLSEWANFRGFAPFNGWSARGGFTRNPYLLSDDPSGSSSGSAVAVSASMCAAAIGTETDGSIVSPSGQCHIVGLKPTLGLLAQRGIIPIAHTQDTAGPMGRSVTDVALLLGAMQSQTGAGTGVSSNYIPYLQRGSLRGKRIGIDTRYFTPSFGGEPDIVATAKKALSVMKNLGATLVETDTGDPDVYFNDEFTALLFEFKVDIAAYLAELRNTSMRTLADLIAFNAANCPEEMRFYGQELFEIAESTSGDLNDPEYVLARTSSVQLARSGIDNAMTRDNLHAVVAPSYTYASSVAAVSGYPNLSLPIGLTSLGRPGGIWMYGRRLSEPSLLAFAYDLEQELGPQKRPTFAGVVPPLPLDAGICSAPTIRSRMSRGRITMPYHIGTGKPFNR
ncbi:MAG: amidase [Phycisphaerae bacterium]|nr:amidase [Gemmatimonadaceae bacterium]